MIIIILNLRDRALAKRAEYTFGQIMRYLGYGYKIIYGLNKITIKNEKRPLLIYYGDNEFDFKNKKSIQIISGRLKRKEHGKLYSFRNRDTALFEHDIILESFNILAREEEIGSKNADSHQRFAAEKSEIFRNLKDPTVNKHALALDKLIKGFFRLSDEPLIWKCHWPENKRFAACLTHDVDIVKFTKSDIFSISKITDYILGRNPYWQFDRVIELEKRHNFSSTFFFCTGKRHDFDPNYSINEEKIVNVIRLLMKRGHEISLHLSYLSYGSNEMMMAEKRELSSVVQGKIGVRTHFLRFKVPDTWILEDKLGFYYDSSLGYSNRIGYRSGFCWPYNPYAIGAEEELGLFELPLSVMDSALFEESKTSANSLKSLKKMLKNVIKSGGVAVMNWHQRVFNEKYFHGWSFVYGKCLEYFEKNGAFVGSARDIIGWVVKRNSISISEMQSKNTLKLVLDSKADADGFALRIICGKSSRLKVHKHKNLNIARDKEGFIVIFNKLRKDHPVSLELTRIK